MEKIEFKKIFNKHIFKDKSFIKMVCFTIVLLLVLVLGNTFGYVSADGGYSLDLGIEDAEFWLNTPDWRESDVYDSSVSVGFDYGIDREDAEATDSTAINNFNCISNYGISGFPSVDAYNNPIDYSSFDAYLIYNNYLLLYDSSVCKVFYVNYSNANRLYIYASDRGAYCVTFGLTYNSNSSATVSGGYYREVYDEYHSNSFHSKNWIQLGAYLGYKLSNAPIYCTANSYSSANDMIDNFFEGSDGVDSNYLLYDGGIEPSEGSGIGGGSNSDSSENETNNMYVDYADWILNNYVGDVPDNYRNMSVSFTSNLNDYIHEHYDDLESQGDAYCIWLDYSVFIDFYYDGVVDYGTISASLGGEFANVQYSHDITTTNTYHWSCNYVFTPTDNDDDYISSGYLLPMDAFIEDYNQIYTMGLSGLFAYLTPSDGSGNMISSTGTRVHTSLTLPQLMQLISEDGIIWDSNYEGLNQFKMTCTAKIIYDDGTTYAPSGTYIETFNLLDGTSTVDSSNMLTNYNPYITNTDEDVTSSLPSTNNSGSSVSTSSTGNVTQTVNVTNEGAKYVPSIINSLIPSSFGDTTTGLAERFTTLVDSNNFITVMASTVPAIPSTVWTYLTEYLGISLYLLACAFVLRLILDLL